MDLGLAGKRALVTGASAGIGLGIASELAAEGCSLALVARDRERVERAAGRIATASGGTVVPLVGDVGRGEDVQRVVREAGSALGRIDVLVVNAGGPRPGEFMEIGDDDWYAAFEVCLLGTVRLIRAALPSMISAGGGRIAVIASSSAREPIEGLVTSNAVRPGVLGLVKTLAHEAGRHGILINAVAPGRILTGRLDAGETIAARTAGTSLEAYRAAAARQIALRRYGTVEEIARAVAFLVSWANSYVTGTTLLVDGGLTRGLW